MGKTSAEAQARALASPIICSRSIFDSLARPQMMEHLQRFDVPFGQYDVKETLKAIHGKAFDIQTTQIAASKTAIPVLEQIYKQPDVISGVNASIPPPRQPIEVVNPIAATTVLASSQLSIFQDAFNMLHNKQHAKRDMAASLDEAIDDCGIQIPSDIYHLVGPDMESELQAVLLCLNGCGKSKLQEQLQRLRNEINITKGALSTDVTKQLSASLPLPSVFQIAEPILSPAFSPPLAPLKQSSVLMKPVSEISTTVAPPLSAEGRMIADLQAQLQSLQAPKPQKSIPLSSPAIVIEAPVSSPNEKAQELRIAALERSLAIATGSAVKGKTKGKSSPLPADNNDDNDDDENDDDSDDDEITSRSSNGESVDSSVGDDKRSVITTSRKLVPLVFETKKEQRKFQKLSELYLATGKRVFPESLLVISFKDLARAALSGKNETALMTYNAELGVYATRFREALSLGLSKRNLVLLSEEFIGPAENPTIVNTGQFISYSGVNNMSKGYPQTIAECFQMVDSLLFQVSHKDSTLSNRASRKWTVNLLEFKAAVTLLIQGLGVTDSPKGKHIVYRAATCRFFYEKLNHAAIWENADLLNEELASEWRKFTDWATNGSVMKPDELNAMIQISGFRCEDNSCGAIASNNHFCPTCKLQTPLSVKLFSLTKQTTSETSGADYRRDKQKAKKDFIDSAAGAAFRHLNPGDPALYAAFIAALPRWAPSSAPDRKEAPSPPKPYDTATCQDYLYKHQAEFDLPVGLRSA
jgi:hypothetical protein